MLCNLCPNKCNVDRTQQLGKCLAPTEMIINRSALHFYEEPPISGTSGSGTIFFGGCTMRCDFCQNYQISRKPQGKIVTPLELSEIIKRLESEGANNINFVTPTHYSDQIKRTLDIYKPKIPVVYNTSGYESVEIIEGLKGYVDIYLPDYKYADSSVAEKLSHRPLYPEYVLQAITAMRNQVADVFENDLMKSGVIIRHLVLPGYIENSLKVIENVKKYFTYTTFSLMSQFCPIPNCKEPNRTLKPIEYKIVLKSACEHKAERVYCQELSSATLSYTPEFDK